MDPHELNDIVREEMRGVLSELAASHRHAAASPASDARSWSPERHVGTSRTSAHGGEGKFQHLRERITVLEDALAKSEADRAAVYARCENLERSLAALNEEKLALLHEVHHSSAQQNGIGDESVAMLYQTRAENERLRAKLEEVPRLLESNRELEREVKKLRRVKERALEERADGVTLSDLHFSNERLSAQLAKLQSPPHAPVFDEAKFRECESAIMAIANDVTQFETRIVHMQHAHALERQQLQDALDRQYSEFSVERAECDRVVGIMSAKLESLVGENAQLKRQIAAANQGGASHTPGRSARR